MSNNRNDFKEDDIRKRHIFNKYLELVKRDVEKYFDQELFEKINCPSCGCKEQNNEFKKSIFSYVSCPVCETLYVSPRPTIDTLNKFYSDSTSTNYWVNDFFKPMIDVRTEKIFKPRVESIISEYPSLNKGRIGDIGAGFGIVLELLKRKWPEGDFIAIEPSIEMAEIMEQKNIYVINKMLEEVEEVEGKFDLLMSFELFEHLYYPETFLRDIFKLLKPGGQILFTTLNGGGFDIQILWENSKSVFPPHHLNFFNTESIKILLDKCGYEDISVETPGKLDWDIVEGMYLNEKVELPRFWKRIIKKDEKTKKELQNWISENNMSSHMKVKASKPLGRNIYEK